MRRMSRVHSVLATAWILSALLAGTQAFAAFRVVVIKVEGNRRVGPDAIRGAMSTKVGGEFDLARLREDGKAIYRMG